ncbi:MAG: serine/threonine-protein kinase [Verrucomicrobiota bacterium]|nr:serine/threonine-protein kinase [Verrucomicrobiota bacterium]
METTDRSEKIAELVETAFELEPAERINFLDESCGEDADLRAEIESLLKFQTPARNFIEQPAYHIAAETLVAEDTSELQEGDEVGGYKIRSLIGEGGMGEVYLADDLQLRRTVALKLIKGVYGRAAFRKQFEQEERILAGLNHPNIARLYGASVTPNETPFFIMEYVAGERLDDYCEHQRLTIPQRLEIFRKICAAVSYAHQNLVIHRDLKPGNVRVTAEGEPKLLDFGIAKLLDEASGAADQTITATRAMTPDYASPEQVRGERMTTASDVYSLGVILYEMLSGEKPLRLTSRRPEEVARAITETVPSRPSAIAVENRKLLGGDLDNIVLMAMRKEPERRYASVGQFSEDIRRHLAGLPVIARKDTWNYRSGKFIRRHKVAVIAAVVLALTLLAGILTTTWEAQRAEEQRALAQRRFDDVRRIAHSLMFEVHDAIENLPGSTAARELLVKRALEYLDSLAGESSGDPILQRELIAAYLKVGNVQGNPTNANLGDSAGALQSYQKALTITEKLLVQSNDTDLKNSLGIILRKVADVDANTDRVADAVPTARRSLQIFRELAEASPGQGDAQMNLAIGQLKLGDILGNPNFANLGDQAGAMRCYEDALSILAALQTRNPSDAKTRRYLGIIHERIGAMRELQNNVAGALAEYQSSAAIRVPLATEFPNDTQIVRDAAIAYEKLANVMTTAGDLEAALTNRQHSLEIFTRLAEADPKNVLAQQSLGISYVHLADLLGAPDSPNLKRPDDAIVNYERARDILLKNSEASDKKIGDLLQGLQAELEKLRR